MKKVIVTGGCGYIGAHTAVDLIENGYEVISIDDNSKSTTALLKGVEKITGKFLKNYKVDLKNFDETLAVFQENTDIAGVIHFAAYKSVGESVAQPLMYYENNIFGLVNLLKCVKEFNIPHFVFSSSCTVYGNPDQIPVTENSALKPAESPYGATKQMGEQIITDFIQSQNITHAVLLRYFNPVGAHLSIQIGEIPMGKPANLVPAITQTAIGKLPQMQVFGNDYDTKDGSCVRDYVHVSDIAHAHTLSLDFLLSKNNKKRCEIFNLGTGVGVTVLEAIKAFEEANNVKLNYKIGLRRAGDVVATYANNKHAIDTLGWKIKYDLKEMMRTAWLWEQKLKTESLFYAYNAALN
ncbi:MAG: UDP-glucose 4-epimerase GalE [Chitinophagaceae bacterium]|jgi:UDP-glucose 4-epimerase|nr:UDP-glucose 4-epimerase GalE [Chitinophagaceae bacterium]